MSKDEENRSKVNSMKYADKFKGIPPSKREDIEKAGFHRVMKVFKDLEVKGTVSTEADRAYSMGASSSSLSQMKTRERAPTFSQIALLAERRGVNPNYIILGDIYSMYLEDTKDKVDLQEENAKLKEENDRLKILNEEYFKRLIAAEIKKNFE